MSSAVASACEMYPCTPRRKKRRKTKRLSLAELNAMTLVVGLLLVNHFSTTFVRRSCASMSKISTSGCASSRCSSASPPSPVSPMHSSVRQSVRRARSPALSDIELLANQTRIFFKGFNCQPAIADENESRPIQKTSVGHSTHSLQSNVSSVSEGFPADRRSTHPVMCVKIPALAFSLCTERYSLVYILTERRYWENTEIG